MKCDELGPSTEGKTLDIPGSCERGNKWMTRITVGRSICDDDGDDVFPSLVPVFASHR